MGSADRECLTVEEAERARRNGREEAYPVMGSHDPSMGRYNPGMSKREAMAAMVMQGLVANDAESHECEWYASVAVRLADCLLERLEHER